MKSREDPSKVFARAEEPGPDRNASTVCRAAILLLVSFAFGLAAPSRGYAAVRTVCASGCKYTTIAAAIAAAKAGDTISILDAVHTESNITVDRNLIIQGKGAANTAVDGAANGTAFTVASGVTATFQYLTIRNGFTDCFFSGGSGGVRNEGTMTVINSIFSNNTACLGGGGIRNEGTMTVINSIFSNNFGGDGGGIGNLGTLTVTDSKFSDNGGDAFGGGIWNEGMTTITDSTSPATAPSSAAAFGTRVR
jgi:predicted outer membrane repeat protein